MNLDDIIPDVFQDVHSSNPILTVLLAAIVPFVFVRIHYFFRVTWPRWIRHVFTLLFRRREVLGVVVQHYRLPIANSLSHNAVIYTALEAYIGHICKQAKDYYRHHPEAARRRGQLARIDEEDGRPLYLPPPSALQHAQYTYDRKASAKVKRGAMDAAADQEKEGVGEASRTLREDYELRTLPEAGKTTELEPGLYVVIQPTRETLEKVRKENRHHSDEGTVESSQAQLDQSRYRTFRDLANRILRMDLSAPTRGAFDEVGDDLLNASDNDEREYATDIIPQHILIETRDVEPLHSEELQRYYRDILKGNCSISLMETSEVMLHPTTRADFFLFRALQWYTGQQKRGISINSRFFFSPLSGELEERVEKKKKENNSEDEDDDEGSDDGEAVMEYYGISPSVAQVKGRRYQLPDQNCKSFDSLFFPQKNMILKCLHDLQNKENKFAIPGSRQTLNLLLYGPPGTGKTSLVKAIAHHLHRHVVSLSLSTIQTNTKLAMWLNEVKLQCVGEKYTYVLTDSDCEDDAEHFRLSRVVRLLPSQVVYLLEDVDAVGDGDGVALKNSDDDDEEGEGEEEEDEEDEDELTPEQKEIKRMVELRKLMAKVLKEIEVDKLTATSLVKTIDGITQPEKRIVVFTTNHPEKLHPSILRAGFFQLKIDMNDLSLSEMTQMVEHYYPTATPSELQMVRAQLESLGSKTYNPSLVEQLCAEHDDIISLSHHLAREEVEDGTNVF